MGKKIPEEDDKRVKITEEDKEDIREMYGEGWTQKELAEEYDVNRKTIYYALNEDKYDEHKERIKENEYWKDNYDKDKHRIYVKRYRERVDALEGDIDE